MAATRVTLSIDERLLKEIRESAAAAGQSLSTWLSEAARRRLRLLAGQSALADYEAEFGEISADETTSITHRWNAHPGTITR